MSKLRGDDENQPAIESPPPFDVFFTTEYPRLVGLAAALCGNRPQAEELAQDALLSAFRHWERIGRYDDPAAWTRRVLVNAATSVWRRRAREAKALVRLHSRPQPFVDLLVGDPEFWSAVRALPARQAQCIALRYLEDRSIGDIAAVLGIAEATVRVHLHAGRKELARRLSETDEGGEHDA